MTFSFLFGCQAPCMNGSTGLVPLVSPMSSMELSKLSPCTDLTYIARLQPTYSHFWPIFLSTHDTPIPFLDPDPTPHPSDSQPFWAYSASGPFYFSGTFPFPYYMHVTPTLPSVSMPCAFSPPLSSPVLETFLHDHIKTQSAMKGKSRRLFPSPSHSAPEYHQPFSTYTFTTLGSPPSSLHTPQYRPLTS